MIQKSGKHALLAPRLVIVLRVRLVGICNPGTADKKIQFLKLSSNIGLLHLFTGHSHNHKNRRWQVDIEWSTFIIKYLAGHLLSHVV